MEKAVWLCLPSFTFVHVRYEIEPQGTAAIGATLFSSDVALRAEAVAAGNAGGLAWHALADADDQRLREAVDTFVRAHLAIIGTAAAASGVLGRKLTLAAQSAHEVEVSTAIELGAAGHVAPIGVPVASQVTTPVTEVAAASAGVVPAVP